MNPSEKSHRSYCFLQARALDRKRQEARDEAMALLDELEHRQDPEVTAGTSEDMPRGPTEALPSGTSGRMSFGAAAGGVNRPHASDDEGGVFEGDSDLEGGSQSEGEGGGEKERGRRRGGVKRGPVARGEELKIPEGEGDLAQLGLSGGFRTATEGPVSVGEGGLVETVEPRGEDDVSMEGGGEGGERAHAWLFRNGGVKENGADAGLADETASAGASARKQKRGSNGVKIAGEKGAHKVGVNGIKKVGPNGTHSGGGNGVQLLGPSEPQMTPAEERGAEKKREGTDSEMAQGDESGGLHAVTFLEGGSEDDGEGVPAENLLQTELSQAELVRRAFAGDDVEADFEARKAEMVR